MYLQSVYAASSEEIEIFLSPVASRSRVREAVRGLSATRQIHSLSMDAQTYYFLEAGLPEFAETATPTVVRAEAAQGLLREWLRESKARGGRFQGLHRGRERTRQPGPCAQLLRQRFALVVLRVPPGRSRQRGQGGRAGPQRSGSQRPRPRGAGRAGRENLSAETGRGAGAPRPGVRPPARDPARSGKPPGAWRGAQKRERPAAWARPGQRAGSAPRPPNPEGRGDSPFRPAQRPRPRPAGPEGGLRSDSGSGAGVAPGRPRRSSCWASCLRRPAGASCRQCRRPQRPPALAPQAAVDPRVEAGPSAARLGLDRHGAQVAVKVAVQIGVQAAATGRGLAAMQNPA